MSQSSKTVKKRIHFALASGLAACAFGMPALAAPATAPSQSTEDLASEVRELRQEVRDLKASQGQLQQQQAQQAAAVESATSQRTTGQVLQDAQAQSTFAPVGNVAAGFDPDRGFFLRSDDGNFLLHPYALLQIRDTSTYRQDGKSEGRDDVQNGFEIRRMQLGASGNAFTPDFTYDIFIQTERSGGDAELFNAYVKYHIAGTPWSVQGGQFKSYFSHEQLTKDRLLMAADRTLVDDILANGEAFSQGVSVIYDPMTNFRAMADFTNGYNNNNINFEEPPNRMANFGMGARGEYKLFGNWGDYDHFTSLGDHGDLMVVGGGIDWTQSGHSAAIRHTIDAQYNTGGFGLYAAYLGRYTSAFTPSSTTAVPNPAVAGDTYDSSVVLQVSYLIPNTRFEPFARYDYMHLDGREFAPGTQNNVHEFTVGTNYYFHGQNAKFTLDLMYLPNGSPVDDNGSGVLLDNGHNEVVLRGQFQLSL